MKRCNNILICTLSALLLAGCSNEMAQNENPIFNYTDDEPVPVLFSVSAQHTGDFTRATESIVTFNSGEAVKVCVSTDEGSSYTDYDFTAAATGQSVALNAPATGDKPYFPAGESTKVDAYAYYPASAGTTFTVADDQTSDASYKASDLMYATNRTITKGSTEGTNLSMAHLMAQLKITAQAQTGSGLTIHKVVVKAQKSVTFTPADGTATATGENGDITALTADGTGYILIPVQQISNVQVEIWTDADGTADKKATFSFTSTGNFEAGNSYSLDLTVTSSQLGATTAISNWNGVGSVNVAVPTGDLTITLSNTEFTYNGNEQKPNAITVKKGDDELEQDADNGYTVDYYNCTNAGTAIIVVRGKGTNSTSVGVTTYTIKPKELTTEMVSPATIDAQSYTGSQITPTVTVTDGSLLVPDKDYTVSYGENINAGPGPDDGSVTVTGIGNYTGSVVRNFKIKGLAVVTTLPTAASGWTEDGSAHNLLSSGGTATNGTMYYYSSTTDSEPSTSSDSGWSTEIPQATNAGTYYIWYYAKADDTANYDDSAVGGSLSVTVVEDVPVGAIRGKFSVSDTQQVYFSMGNLRYASSKWSFFDHQYEYYAAYSNTSWDKFGWSTSASYGKSTSTSNSSYSGSFVDWGKNAITNGGNTADKWRTLTREEWNYVFTIRPTKSKGSTVGSTSYASYTQATINTDGTSVNGMILFPDGGSFTASEASWGTINDKSAWSTKCTVSQWSALEAKGCVFLPAAGRRSGSELITPNGGGSYWSSTLFDSEKAYDLFFAESYLDPDDHKTGRSNGFSVRLVHNVN